MDLVTAEQFLLASGVPLGYRLQPLRGGANNQVFQVRAGGCTWLLKHYYFDARDGRDRLGAEWQFSCFAWSLPLHCLPRPLANDRSARMALFEFIPGRCLEPVEVNSYRIQEALAFLAGLDRGRLSPLALALPSASEACFSWSEHMRCIAGRVERLARLDHAGGVAPGVRNLADEIACAWANLSARVLRRLHEAGIEADRPLTGEERCLSPSDFGFHNALLAADGRLRFLDFEYAGWDDPAKVICDFFCQPRIPAPMDLFPAFVEKWTRLRPAFASAALRAAWLLPLYRLKWCCIALNDFLPAAVLRRQFAFAPEEMLARREQQLETARHLLAAARAEGQWLEQSAASPLAQAALG